MRMASGHQFQTHFRANVIFKNRLHNTYFITKFEKTKKTTSKGQSDFHNSNFLYLFFYGLRSFQI